MTTFTPLFLAVVTLAGSPAPSASTSASSRADRLFHEGRDLMKANRFAEASTKLMESEQLEPSPVTLVNLAICHEALGQRGRALFEFREVVAEAGGKPAVLDVASGHAKALEATLANAPLPAIQVTFASPSGAEGATVSLDGIGLKPALLAKRIPVDAGSHEIVARDGRGRESHQVVHAHDRAVEEVTVAFEDVPPPPVPDPVPLAGPPSPLPPSPIVAVVGGGATKGAAVVVKKPVDDSPSWCTTGCKAALGVAGGGLVGWAVTGAIAHAKRSTFDQTNRDPSASTGARTSAHDSAERWQWINLGFVGATVVGAGVAAVLIGRHWSEARAAAAPSVTVAPFVRNDGFGLGLATEWSGL